MLARFGLCAALPVALDNSRFVAPEQEFKETEVKPGPSADMWALGALLLIQKGGNFQRNDAEECSLFTKYKFC